MEFAVSAKPADQIEPTPGRVAHGYEKTDAREK